MHDDYMNTEELAKIIGVSKSLVEKWRRKGLLMPDVIGHGKNRRGGVYYYSKERVQQLASVYEPKLKPVQYAYTSATSRTATEEETNTATVRVHPDEKQSRLAELVNFFNQLYGKIPETNFAYFWTKTYGTYPFAIPAQISLMAQKAIELSDKGVDIWHSVNPVSIEPADGKRGNEFAVSFQTAIVVDIDIRSDAHKGDPSLLATDINEAKSFLPFTPSIIIHSGYGLHAYYIFDTPIAITDNREEIKRRNNLLLEVIRARAERQKN